MAKGAVNKHLQARIAYLEKASKYLAQQQYGHENQTFGKHNEATDAPTHGLPQLLSSHLRSVSLKSQIRLTQDVKRSICRKCDMPLIESSTSDITIENDSKDKAKPWADIRVITCRSCGTKKRFPIGAKRQTKKKNRLVSTSGKDMTVDSKSPLQQQSDAIKT
ncbi:hypothetical protein MBLNU457_5769t1 [Dothideomycetes sp. NU457]